MFALLLYSSLESSHHPQATVCIYHQVLRGIALLHSKIHQDVACAGGKHPDGCARGRVDFRLVNGSSFGPRVRTTIQSTYVLVWILGENFHGCSSGTSSIQQRAGQKEALTLRDRLYFWPWKTFGCLQQILIFRLRCSKVSVGQQPYVQLYVGYCLRRLP